MCVYMNLPWLAHCSEFIYYKGSLWSSFLKNIIFSHEVIKSSKLKWKFYALNALTSIHFAFSYSYYVISKIKKMSKFK